MSAPKIEFLGDMQKLTLGERDTLVIRLKCAINGDRIESLCSQLRLVFPDTKVLVLPEYVDIGVLAGDHVASEVTDGAH
jgi:hypothetical protein